jgi:hypothetical protein
MFDRLSRDLALELVHAEVFDAGSVVLQVDDWDAGRDELGEQRRVTTGWSTSSSATAWEACTRPAACLSRSTSPRSSGSRLPAPGTTRPRWPPEPPGRPRRRPRPAGAVPQHHGAGLPPIAAAQIQIQGARCPEHLQRLIDR